LTDTTSPVAKLAANLPKGNGLSRAVEKLHGRNGAMVPFVGLLRVDESGEDLNDVLKIRTSIQRLELAFGPSAADVKDLITRCSTEATSVPGQQTFSLGPTVDELDAQRAGLVRDLLEWGTEQTPALDVAGVTDRWNSWHGGHYDARLEEAPVPHLREFALVVGAIAEDQDPVLKPFFSSSDDTPAAEDATGDAPADDQPEDEQ
jgi:hypothetical protein